MTFMWKVNSRIHIFSVLSPGLLEMVRDRQREMCGSKNRTFLSCVVGEGMREGENVRLEELHISLSCCMGEGMRERERARGREHKVLRILRSLCCLILHSSMGQAERNVRLLEPHISLSFLVGDGTQE